MQSNLLKYAAVASALSFVAYLLIVIIDAVLFYGLAYWLLLAALWFVPIYYACKTGEDRPFNIRKSISVDGFIALITAICAIVSAVAYLLARPTDKLIAIGAIVDLSLILVFGYLANQKDKSADVSKGFRYGFGGLKGFLLFVLFILHVGSTYQAVGTASDYIDYGTFRGKYVTITVEGQSTDMHIVCEGEKVNATDPIVWFEHGLGGNHLDFYWVQQNVTQSKLGRSCAYDHAGLGWSGLPRYPRATERVVQELQALLDAENIKDDLLIVGHSMAGYTSRMAQRVLKNKIAGVVLVDPVDTDNYEVCEVGKTKPDWFSLFGKHVNTFGFGRFVFATKLLVVETDKSVNARAYNSRIFYPENLQTRASESTYFRTSCGQVKNIVNTVPIPGAPLKNGKIDDTFGSIPYAVTLALDGVNADQMGRLSTDSIVRNLTTTHQGAIFDQKYAAVTSELLNIVWDKIKAQKRQ